MPFRDCDPPTEKRHRCCAKCCGTRLAYLRQRWREQQIEERRKHEHERRLKRTQALHATVRLILLWANILIATLLLALFCRPVSQP